MFRRPLQDQDPLKAQADGQVQNDGGGPQAFGAGTVYDEKVITQVRGQGGDPQRGGEPVALGPGLVVLQPDPDRARPQRAEDGREHQAAADGGIGQRVRMILVQELDGLQHPDDRQDRDQAQRGGADRAGGQLPVDQQGQDSDSRMMSRTSTVTTPWGLRWPPDGAPQAAK